MILKGKKTLLLIDNFLAYELAVEQIEEARELKMINVRNNSYLLLKLTSYRLCFSL